MKHILTILLCALLLTACGNRNSNPTTEPETSSETEVVDTQSSPTSKPEDAEATIPEEEIYLTIYSPDDSLEGFNTVQIPVDAITESAIVEQLIAAGVLTEGISVQSLEQVTSSDAPETIHLNVDFNSDFRDLILSQGTSGEWAVMGSVVNTFLNAYGAESMSITVDGEILESGHVAYDFPLTFFE